MDRGQPARVARQVESQRLELLHHAARAQRLLAVTPEDQPAAVRQPRGHRRRQCDDVSMRTTVTIEDDVLAAARALAARSVSLRSALSQLARRGFRRTPAGDDDGLPVIRVAAAGPPTRGLRTLSRRRKDGRSA